MTDRELLELAAKAAGIERCTIGYIEADSWGWRPLWDDGDALRLAVKLNFEVRICNGVAVVNDGHSDLEHVEVDPSNPYSATRRAIVQAAAEIGKEMN